MGGEGAAQAVSSVDILAGQDFPGKGAGIFRIEIDGTAKQGVPEDPGAAQALSVLRPGAGLLHECGGHVGQNN